MTLPPADAPRRATRLWLVWVYAIAMGWLEGVVVVYIRALLGMPHSGELPPAAQTFGRLHGIAWLLVTEQSRELATLIMLAAVAWLAAERPLARLGAFLVAFGVWDLAYYGALYALVRWPPSLGTMDLLFLIPQHPWWYQPVWVPMLVAALMVAGGTWLAWRHPRA